MPMRCAKLFKVTVAFTLMATPASLAAGGMIAIAGDPVSTTSGAVSGTKLASGQKAYLGIPFAKPPVGDLRWSPPQPITWEGVWNADRKGPECIQVLRPHNINHYFGEEPSSEDCLYMNIWTPADAKAGDRLPVVVFIYGGGGTIGSSGLANYDGANIAKRGAIFVNFNYRVGLLGFMAHPQLTKEQGGHSGNYGYLDQQAALQWVHDNIAQFGGDASKVVISGQSFGAGSVAAQYTSPLSKGLFSGAMMSSACNFTGGGVPLSEGEKVGLEAQDRLGVESLAAMRDVPADRILALQAESQVGANNPGLRASAVIDGYFWTGSKEDAFNRGQSSDVPIIASSNGDDIDASRYPLTRARTVDQYVATAQEMYGGDTARFLQLFPVHSDAEVQPMAHQAAMENGMLESSRSCADILASHSDAAAYIDIFDHKHPYAPGIALADQDVKTIGAYHTADIPYWFDTLDKYNSLRVTRAPKEWDRTLIDKMAASLISFARNGSPSTAGFDWPAYSGKSPRYVVFGNDISVKSMNLERMDWLKAHPPKTGGEALPARARD